MSSQEPKLRPKVTSKSGPCRTCGIVDSLTKLICQECKYRWHYNSVKKCISRPRGNDVFSGNWRCDECRPKTKESYSEKNIQRRTNVVSVEDRTEPIASGSKQVIQPVLNQDEIVHEITSDDMLTGTTGVLTRQAARRLHENKKISRSLCNQIETINPKPPRSRHSLNSKLSINSERQREALEAIQEEVKLREQRHKAEEDADQRRIERLEEKEEDARKLREAKEALTMTSHSYSESSSAYDSESSSGEHYDITKSWLNQQDRRKRNSKQQPVQHRRTMVTKLHHEPELSLAKHQNIVLPKTWLNPRASEQEFLEVTMVGTSIISITKAQRNARHLGGKDLPNFSGDPLHWAQFISVYINTTRLCGYTDDENISRLNKCLHGPALDAVRTDLYDASTLPSALTTLRMLFGRPDTIFKSAVDQVKAVPAIKPERLDTLINLSAKVKSLCDTVRHAGMTNYLNNPLLLNEIIDKLPVQMKMDWARCCRLHEIEEDTTLDTLNQWLRENAELACKVNNFEPFAASKSKDKNKFHASHATDSPATSISNFCQKCQISGHRIQDCRTFKASDIRKKWNVVNRRRLCKCCLEKHLLINCPEKKICGEGDCKAFHNPLLHSFKRPSKEIFIDSSTPVKSQSTINSEEINKPKQESNVLVHHPVRGKIYYQIVPIIIYGENGKSIETFAFLDAGSVVTLIDEQIANQIDLQGEPSELTLRWTANIVRREKNSRKVSLQISARKSEKMFQLNNVRTTETLNLPTQSFLSADLKHFPHLKGLPIEQYVNKQPTILIGIDNYQLMAPQRAIEGKWEDPVAIETRIGWTILGAVQSHADKNCAPVNFHNTEDELHQLVKGFFSLESLGVRVSDKSLQSCEDNRAKTLLQKTVRKLPEGHYEAGLLWRSDDIKLPQSRAMALHRLKAFERKLIRFPDVKIIVHQQFEDYINKGYLVKMTHEESTTFTDKSWYLPIFAVSNPNKPNKTRLVWDAAAISHGTSLNANLLKGPDMLVNLVGMLFKFREHSYAVSGDIRQMFHQIKISKDDQEAQRCLWRFNMDLEPDTYKFTVMTFGAACSPATSQYVKNLNASVEAGDNDMRAVEAITRRHYVDDYIDSFSDIDECVAVTRRVVEIHRQGGFELRNIMSNSEHVLSLLAAGVNPLEKIIGDRDESFKVLGMRWNVKDDFIRFSVNHQRVEDELLKVNNQPTKRVVLRLLMMIYDPLGLLGFFVVKGKLLLKEIWRSSIEWDTIIGENQLMKFTQWIGMLPIIESCRVPRCYVPKSFENHYALHTFVDASEHAAAAVSYLVADNPTNQTIVSFVASKTKIAPNKTISIPRLELQAALLGARLANHIREHHSITISKLFFWSDSKSVLCWIRTPRSYKPFVAHRVGEIIDTTDVQDWQWVPSSQNIADEATKWTSSKSHIPVHWFSGPAFLTKPKSEWPTESKALPNQLIQSDDELEVRCQLIAVPKWDDLTPDLKSFSKFSKLLRTQAYILRYYYRRSKKADLTTYELRQAEIYIIRTVQQSAFPEEIMSLKAQAPIKKNSKIRQYSPYLDNESIIRMNSRLRKADYLSFDQIFPIILPRNHQFTSLLISNFHQKYYHGNDGTVLNELQQRYVIPHLRSQLKSVKAKCGQCRIDKLRPEIPEMATLPISRLAVGLRPFTHTGTDYFGPMMIKIGRRYEKRWGVIFTCLTTRAVHLEVATSLSADSFLLVLRCFMGRRGLPKKMYCDNGTNYHGAETELRKQMQENLKSNVNTEFAQIEWSFNPPAAPHMGGAWERLIRSVKIGLRKALPERLPSEEMLRTCLIDIEAIINSRPLTYVSTDPDNLEALTPHHFLLGSSSGIKPWGKFTDNTSYLRSEWKKQQCVSQMFWQRWTTEYLPEISHRTKWYDKVKPLEIGDVVAVVDKTIPNKWQLGRISDVIRSSDGNVRQATIRTSTGYLKRPGCKLAVLIRENEIRAADNCPLSGGSVTDSQ